MLTPHDYCTGWRQTRVFLLPPFTIGAFVSFHLNITRSLLDQGVFNGPFFVSHYVDDRDMHDTDEALLLQQAEFLQNGQHGSIRFRFRESGNIENALDAAFPAGATWKSDFRDYDIIDGMSGTRFSDYPKANAGDHERRAQMVAEILHWNTRMYLDSFRMNGDKFEFETSGDGNNRWLGEPIQSVLHMMLNPRFLRDKVVFPQQTF